jgi:hypothetical protein
MWSSNVYHRLAALALPQGTDWRRIGGASSWERLQVLTPCDGMWFTLGMTFPQMWTTKDKSTWGDGPWQNEPDKVQWIDPATNLDCLLHRPHGAWCGYVGVGPDHPLHGEGEDDFEVHGGITFTGSCQEGGDPSVGICHVPQPGRPSDVWWFGFDCSHSMDTDPEREAVYRKYGEHGFSLEDHGTYRDMVYVIAEVTALARQIADHDRA